MFEENQVCWEDSFRMKLATLHLEKKSKPPKITLREDALPELSLTSRKPLPPA